MIILKTPVHNNMYYDVTDSTFNSNTFKDKLWSTYIDLSQRDTNIHWLRQHTYNRCERYYKILKL